MSDDLGELQGLVGRWLATRPGARVLEAGCGSTSHLDLGPGITLVGLDISAAQLARHPRLDERILGDLQSYPLPEHGFDLVICWDVLEHLAAPARALENLARALAPGGLLVLAFPNLLSLKGLVAKSTGFVAHAWFYRWLVGDTRTRDEGFGQFPTRLAWTMRPSRVLRFARERGLVVEFARLYEGPVPRHLRARYPVAGWIFDAAGMASRALTLGRHDLRQSDVLLVLRRPAASGAAGR